MLSQLHSLVSVNFAVEVDLSGQVGAEVSGGVYVGAVGGQVDFTRAAALTGKRSIIALRSTFARRLHDQAALDGGVVTTARSDVDVVVTEHGAAHLRGLQPRRAGAPTRRRRRPRVPRPAREGDQPAMSPKLPGAGRTSGRSVPATDSRTNPRPSPPPTRST